MTLTKLWEMLLKASVIRSPIPSNNLDMSAKGLQKTQVELLGLGEVELELVP